MAASSTSGQERARVSPEIAAEAAVWIARLHGPNRSAHMERECLAWQALSEAHREAFERCTETWQAVPRVSVASAFAAADAGGSGAARRGQGWKAAPMRVAVVLAAFGLVVGGGAVFQGWLDRGLYHTGVGEQQVVVLKDGTRMSLNTATDVRVRLGGDVRSIDVRSGEALFEVAKDPRRPFVVRAAGSEVMATGTVFSVRVGSPAAGLAEQLSVTLIEGQVKVRAAAGGPSAGLPADQPLVMQPGERLSVDGKRDPATSAPALHLDRPNIEQLVAWKRSEAVFDNATLADAVAEMNRYSRTPVVLQEGLAIDQLRVSGLFRTGDNAAFARAVAALHGLSVGESSGRFELTRPQQDKH